MLPLLSHARLRALFAGIVVTTVCCIAGAGTSLAAKGGNAGSSSSTGSGLSLVSEIVHNSPNTAAPLWCLNEDDYHYRAWSGSLNGSFTATDRVCGTDDDYANGMYWRGGGIGLQADIWVTGTLQDLTITSPTGDSHHAVLVGSSTSKGTRTDHYQVCYTPSYSISTGISGWPLDGGTWQIAASGTFSKSTFATTAKMTDVSYQQMYCPPSEQNLVP